MAASEAGPRVALLARAGDACQRIAEALREAGAELVLVADPIQADPAQVRLAQPQAVLVALEPAIEDAIDRFEDVLADPGYMVIFEEAEQAAQRSGWDAARWLRHLSAKLHRHDDVLPAGAERADELQLTAEPMPAQPARVDFDDAIVALTGEAQDRADEVPQDGLEGLHPTSGPGFAAGEDLTIDWGSAPLELTLDDDTGPAMPAPADAADASPGFGTLTLSLDDIDDIGDEADGLDFDPERFSRAGQAEESAGGIEEFLAARATSLYEAHEPGDAAGDTGSSGAARPDNDGARANPEPAAAASPLDFSTLSLVEDDHIPVAPAGSASPAPAFDLESLGAGLSLVDPDSYGHGKPPGLVLIEAGLGGPDAVRQLLAALPARFPKPILIRLPLEGGRYDRLVKQMTRATSAPVAVAEGGAQVAPGSIHFVPPGLGIRVAGAGWVFDPGQPMDPALLPPSDSVVVFLSGADAALVPAVSGEAWAGGVLGQTPDEGCYDPAAALAAIEAGAAHGSPAELAAQLLARWPATADGPHTDPNGTP